MLTDWNEHHMKLHTPSVLVGAVVAGAVLLSGGMGKPGPAGGGAPAAATPPASQIRVSDLVRPKSAPSAVYTVRGEVTALPEKGKPQTELMIKHEAIDDFKNKDGKVVCTEGPFDLSTQAIKSDVIVDCGKVPAAWWLVGAAAAAGITAGIVAAGPASAAR